MREFMRNRYSEGCCVRRRRAHDRAERVTGGGAACAPAVTGRQRREGSDANGDRLGQGAMVGDQDGPRTVQQIGPSLEFGRGQAPGRHRVGQVSHRVEVVEPHGEAQLVTDGQPAQGPPAVAVARARWHVDELVAVAQPDAAVLGAALGHVPLWAARERGHADLRYERASCPQWNRPAVGLARRRRRRDRQRVQLKEVVVIGRRTRRAALVTPQGVREPGADLRMHEDRGDRERVLLFGAFQRRPGLADRGDVARRVEESAQHDEAAAVLGELQLRNYLRGAAAGRERPEVGLGQGVVRMILDLRGGHGDRMLLGLRWSSRAGGKSVARPGGLPPPRLARGRATWRSTT
jgi:hypothetical protein